MICAGSPTCEPGPGEIQRDGDPLLLCPRGPRACERALEGVVRVLRRTVWAFLPGEHRQAGLRRRREHGGRALATWRPDSRGGCDQDDLLAELAVWGTPETAKDRLERFAEVEGVDAVGITFPQSTDHDVVRTTTTALAPQRQDLTARRCKRLRSTAGHPAALEATLGPDGVPLPRSLIVRSSSARWGLDGVV